MVDRTRAMLQLVPEHQLRVNGRIPLDANRGCIACRVQVVSDRTSVRVNPLGPITSVGMCVQGDGGARMLYGDIQACD
jgi:hypothetical protein